MRVDFRQGLISFQTSAGSPVFLQASGTSGYVAHMVTPTPTRATFAHGASNYLQTFLTTVDPAWGPMVPGMTNYLYWDVDLLTADVTFGLTTLTPVTALTAPSSPANDQHWFDLSTTTMRVWSTAKAKWVTRIRLFAGHVVNGNVNTIVTYDDGTQVGLTGPANAGYVMRDTLLQPLRKFTGEFLTDDETVHVDSTVGTAGTLVQPVNHIVPIRAGETIPAMSLVYLSGEDTVRLASSNPTLVPARVPVGMVVEPLATGDVGTLTAMGEIGYDQWDWSGHAGEPLYVDYNGQLTLTRPQGLLAFRVGFVKNPTTVLLAVDAETYPQVYQATDATLTVVGTAPVDVDDFINGLGERVVTITVPVVGGTNGLMTPAQATAVTLHETRIGVLEDDVADLQVEVAGKADVGHLHAIADVTMLQATLDGKAAAVHAHLISDVTGLQVALNAKADASHLHAIADTTGLQGVLDGKSDVTHSHALDDLSDVDLTTDAPTSGDVLTYSGGTWVPAAGGSASLTISDNHNRDDEQSTEGLYPNVTALVLGNGLRVRESIDKGNGSFIVRIEACQPTITFNHEPPA